MIVAELVTLIPTELNSLALSLAGVALFIRVLG